MVPVTLADPPQVVYVRKHPDLSERDIEKAQMIDGGRVLLTFTRSAKPRLESLTRASVGGVLVVVFNNRVVYAPVIDVALTEGKFVIPSNVSPQEVDALNSWLQQHSNN